MLSRPLYVGTDPKHPAITAHMYAHGAPLVDDHYPIQDQSIVWCSGVV